MKKTKQTSQEEFEKLPNIPKDQYKFLWEDDHWDGPVSGMLLYNNEKLYFMQHGNDIFDEKAKKWKPRTFTVHRLKPNILALQESWHKLFQDLVGDHCDFDKKGRLTGFFNSKEKPNWRDFYIKQKEEYDPIEPDLDDPAVAEVIARIEW